MEEHSASKSYKFGCRTLKTLCRILWILFRVNVCWITFIIIGLVSLLQEYIVYNVGVIPSGFYKCLVDKDWDAFVRHTIIAFALIFAIAIVLSSKQFLVNMFYAICRQILSKELQNLYFQLNRFYYLNNMTSQLTDNPDQRITQDVDKFTEELSKMISPVVVSPFVIGYYSYICFQNTGWVGPVVVFAVFVVSAIINKFLIKPVMNMVILQEKFEGFYRFKHMHVRTHAESIALIGSEKAEQFQSDKRLVQLVDTQQRLFMRQFPLNIAVNIFDYAGSIISYLILARPVFTGQYDNISPAEMGALISNNAFFTIYLISAFSKLVDLTSSASQIAGLTYRVSELLDTIRSIGKCEMSDDEPKKSDDDYNTDIVGPMQGKTVIKLRDVTFGSPSHPGTLVSKLSLDIVIGTNLLITGNSSSGKTSLLRVIKGLWEVREGTVKRCLKFQPSDVFFLPQKPLLTDGSLLHQIVYPLYPEDLVLDRSMAEETDRIMRYIEYVGLQHILHKAGALDLEVDWNWNSILTPGEAQRLSFVRLFYHRPFLAFLDEATSALSPEYEDKMYKKCKELQISLVSVGHNKSLLKYHSTHLHLLGDGTWTIENISQ